MPQSLLLLCGFFTTTQARQRNYLTKVFRFSEAQTKLLYEQAHGQQVG